MRYTRRKTEKILSITQLERVRDELKSDTTLSHSIEAVKIWNGSPQELFCLGLGSPTCSANARAQLAFLLELSHSLGIGSSQIFLYDPVFTDEDRTLFTELGLQVLSESRATEHVADAPSLFFMPHCELELYESVITAHWSEQLLSRIIFVCNHFADYVENNPKHKLELKAPHLLRLVPFLAARGLPASNSYPMAFNNTSVQFLATKPPRSFFSMSKVPESPQLVE